MKCCYKNCRHLRTCALGKHYELQIFSTTMTLHSYIWRLVSNIHKNINVWEVIPTLFNNFCWCLLLWYFLRSFLWFLRSQVSPRPCESRRFTLSVSAVVQQTLLNMPYLQSVTLDKSCPEFSPIFKDTCLTLTFIVLWGHMLLSKTYWKMVQRAC